MSTTLSAIKDALAGATLLTAINAKLTAASLPTCSTTFGIQRHERLLLEATKLPALAVTVGTARAGTRYTGAYDMVATATYHLVVADSGDKVLMGKVEQYVDCLRAAVETTFSALYWVESDAEGQCYSADNGVPVRLLTVRFDVHQHALAEGVV